MLNLKLKTNHNLLNVISVVLEEPEFTEVIDNVTVPAGRHVKLACSVKNLGSYKVHKNIAFIVKYQENTYFFI